MIAKGAAGRNGSVNNGSRLYVLPAAPSAIAWNAQGKEEER